MTVLWTDVERVTAELEQAVQAVSDAAIAEGAVDALLVCSASVLCECS